MNLRLGVIDGVIPGKAVGKSTRVSMRTGMVLVLAAALLVVGCQPEPEAEVTRYRDGEAAGPLTAGFGHSGGTGFGYAPNDEEERASFGLVPLCLRTDADGHDSVRIESISAVKTVHDGLKDPRPYVRLVDVDWSQESSTPFVATAGEPPFPRGKHEGDFEPAEGSEVDVRCREANGSQLPPREGRTAELVVSADEDGTTTGGWDGIAVRYEDEHGRRYELEVPATFVVCGDEPPDAVELCRRGDSAPSPDP